MLSARPMEQVSLALPNPPSSSANDPDSLHLFTSPDKRLATALDSNQLAALLVPGKDSPVLSWQNSQSPIHSKSTSAGNLLTIPDCDETGKLPPQVCCVCVFICPCRHAELLFRFLLPIEDPRAHLRLSALPENPATAFSWRLPCLPHHNMKVHPIPRQMALHHIQNMGHSTILNASLTITFPTNIPTHARPSPPASLPSYTPPPILTYCQQTSAVVPTLAQQR